MTGLPPGMISMDADWCPFQHATMSGVLSTPRLLLGMLHQSMILDSFLWPAATVYLNIDKKLLWFGTPGFYAVSSYCATANFLFNSTILK